MTGAGDAGKWIQPEWWGPPAGWFGGVLPIAPVVAGNSRGAIVVEDLAVYPTGLAFELRALLRPPSTPRRAPGDDRVRPAKVEGRVRFRVELKDGRSAANDSPVGGPGDFTILAVQEGEPVSPDPEVNVVLSSSSGASGPEFIRERRFLWPLPADGVRLFGSWPDIGLEEESVEIDAATITDGLSRARPAWH